MGDFLNSFFSEQGLRTLITTGGIPILFLIIFAETGLLIGFFLPGDTLLLMTGLLSKGGYIELDFVPLCLILSLAAVAGDAVGYYIGKKAGSKLYERPDSRFFKREHLLKTRDFYEKYGGITIVLARFVPIVRTFAPTVAGTVGMQYRKFVVFNIIGGVLWIWSGVAVGYFLAEVIPGVEKYMHLAILGVVGLSLLLPLVHWLRTRKKSAPKTNS
jgi:membrane-associated protein